jgi:hypothetical protein
MASVTSSAARRVRFMARSANTARDSSSAVRPGCSRSSARTVSASSPSVIRPHAGSYQDQDEKPSARAEPRHPRISGPRESVTRDR